MRILLVEDEERLAAAIKRGLHAEGFAVDVVHDGADGLRMAQMDQYDAIVMDIMLPGMNGYRVCSLLREAGSWTPILMLTALNDELDEAEALDCGADDFLTKPFSYVVLLARLRALLRRGAPERPAVLQVGDLSLDPGSHRCKLGETDIELTSREFSLLEYFMRNPDRILSKVELLEHVWDLPPVDASNVVEVYVGYLRRKIDVQLGRSNIRTVRGAGYRLVAAEE